MRTHSSDANGHTICDAYLSKVPPHSEEAERRVIGAMLFDNHAIPVVTRVLQSDDFFNAAHRLVFSATLQVFDQRGRADPILVGDHLAHSGLLEDAGGVSYLESIADSTPTAALAEHHARLVREKAFHRRLIDLGHKVALEGLDGIRKPYELLAELQQEALALREYSAPLEAQRRTSWAAPDLFAAQFPDLVWTVDGLLPVGLTFVAGKPKLGKSWLALQLALAVVSGRPFLGRKVQQGSVWYVALEDSERRMRSRLVAQGARPEQVTDLLFEFAWDPLDKDGFLRLVNAVAQAKPRPQVIIFDTLSRALSSRTDQLDVGHVTQALSRVQRFSLDEGLNTVTLDHHRKSSGSKADERDPLSDILGSVAKGAVADAVWSIYRKRGDRGAALWVAGRDLDDLELRVQFNKQTCTWEPVGDARELARSEAEHEVLDALKDLGGEADAASIAKELGKTRRPVAETLKQLACNGVLDENIVKTSVGTAKMVYRRKPA